MTRKDVKGDQPSGGETTWTNTGATRYGRGQHKTGSFGDDMLRPSPNHGIQRLPNDDDDDDDNMVPASSINAEPMVVSRHICTHISSHCKRHRACLVASDVSRKIRRPLYKTLC